MKDKSKSKQLHKSNIIEKSFDASTITFQFPQSWMQQYIKSSGFLTRLQNKSPEVILHLDSSTLCVQNYQDIDKIRKQIQRHLSSVLKAQILNQNLSEKQYDLFLKNDMEIKRLLEQNFEFECYLQGKMIVFSSKLSESSLKRKQNQLAGYVKETLSIFITNQQGSFAHYQQDQIRILLRYICRVFQKQFTQMASQSNLHLQTINSFEKEIKFTVIGFKKYFIDFYDKVIQHIMSLKTAIKKFGITKVHSEDQLKSLLNEQQKRLESEYKMIVKYEYMQGYIVALGDTFTDSINLYINSNVYDLKVIPDFDRHKSLIAYDKYKWFIHKNKQLLFKDIKRRVSYRTFDFEKMQIVTDEGNYKQIIDVIQIFVRQHMPWPDKFHFDHKYQKEVFMKYFKKEFSQIDDDTETSIIFYYTIKHQEFIRNKLNQCYLKIQHDIKKILIPSDVDVKSNGVLVDSKQHSIPIGYSCNLFSVNRFSIEISNRIEEQDVDCIICCYSNKDGRFYDRYIGDLFDESTKTILSKPTKKQISLHRISYSYCKNVIFHKFNKLNSHKVFNDLNTMFDQIKTQIHNITFVVPYYYEDWHVYVADFVDNLTAMIKEFELLQRLVIVCESKLRNEVKRIILDLPAFKMKQTPKQQISLHYLLQHQCLNFYTIQCVDRQLLEKYSLNPLLISILQQHKYSNTKNMIVNIPYLKSNPKEYLVNLNKKIVIDTINRKQLSKQFVKTELSCINSLMKKSINNSNIKYQYILVYVEEKKIAGNYFEFDVENNTLICLNDQFKKTKRSYQFAIQENIIVKSHIVQGYTPEIQYMLQRFKFNQC